MRHETATTLANAAIAAAAKALEGSYKVDEGDNGSIVVSHRDGEFTTTICARTPEDSRFMKPKMPYVHVSRWWTGQHSSRIMLRDGGYNVQSIINAVHAQHANRRRELAAHEQRVKEEEQRKQMEDINREMARTLSDAVYCTGLRVMRIEPSPTLKGCVSCTISGATLSPTQVMAIANIINGVQHEL